MFIAGQKVVCINDADIDSGIWDGDRPIKGEIYTVKSCHWHRGEEGLLLEEICNHSLHGGLYRARRFRPLTETKRPTDIAIFRKIADDVSNGVIRKIKEDA